MLSKECFKTNFGVACSIKGVNVPKENLIALYQFVKYQFTDAEFSEITKDVVLNENFYGKMPDISLWTKRKASKNDSVKNKELNAFIDKVTEYLNWDYLPTSIKKEFSASLTQSESRALAVLGGIDTIRRSVYANGEFDVDKVAWKIKDLTAAFNVNYSQNVPQIEEEKDYGMIEELKKLGFEG